MRMGIHKIINQELNKIKGLVKVDDLHFMLYKEESFVEHDCKFKENSEYLIELNDEIVKPSRMFNLSENYNRGIIPQSKHLHAYLKVIMGNMLKFDACGYDINSNQDKDDRYSDLWLPDNYIKIVKVIKEY